MQILNSPSKSTLKNCQKILINGENHFQHYWERYHVQKQFSIAAIGGKDSMSGTFNDMNVPPTLVSFAVDVINTDKVISPEFKKADSQVVLIYANIRRRWIT